jgi:S-ribosylhomocysteine lyase
MEKIASFRIDHLRLKRGVYVSRVDRFGASVLTTFDLRMTEPNNEPVLDIPAIHTLEHMGATFLRSHAEWGARTVYFGPMGCRTGLYMVLEGQLTSAQVVHLVKEFLEWTLAYRGEVPGASAAECGNWRDHNLEMAQFEARRYLRDVVAAPKPENLSYPE